jgi:hypothetical protein
MVERRNDVTSVYEGREKGGKERIVMGGVKSSS